MTALELIRYKPDMAEKMLATMNATTMKISASMTKFSEEFEQALGITRSNDRLFLPNFRLRSP